MDDDEGHTINDELRMMGLEGDDEDGMEEEREELFGRRGNVEVIMPPPPPLVLVLVVPVRVLMLV
jgi:hypothetical protein